MLYYSLPLRSVSLKYKATNGYICRYDTQKFVIIIIIIPPPLWELSPPLLSHATPSSVCHHFALDLLSNLA